MHIGLKTCLFLFGALVLHCFSISAQTNRTMTIDGNYNDASRWSGSNIADNIGENAVFQDGVNSLLRNGDNYIVANVEGGNNGLFRMQSGAQYQVGASGNEGEFDVGNDYQILVRGNLIIFGDLIIGNSVELTVLPSQNLTVTGDIIIGNDAVVDIRGELNVGGKFETGTNLEFDASNSAVIDINGSFEVESDANLDFRSSTTTIGGDLIAGNGLVFAISNSADLQINGDLDIGDSATLDLRAGSLNIGGSLEAGNSLDFSTSNASDIDVAGNFEMGNSASLDLQAATIDIVGNIVAGNSIDIDAANGNQLTVGGAADLGNNAQIAIAGSADFSFGGNFESGNNLDLGISGGSSLGIDGITDLGNNTDIDISGGSNMNLGDDLNLSNNTDISVAGGSNVDINGDVDCGGTGGNFDVDVSGGSTMSAFSCNCPSDFCGEFTSLPVELLYFRAELAGDMIKLIWATQMEEANEYFSIEKSLDGNEWIHVAQIPGAGYSNDFLEYDYFDMEVESGHNYYRLKQTDYDGNFEYFDVVGVFFGASEGSPQLSVSKNGDQYFANINLVGSRATMVLYSTTGAVLQQELLQGEEIIRTSIPLKRTNSGLYFIKVLGNDQSFSRKVLLQY